MFDFSVNGCPEIRPSENLLYETPVFPEHAAVICALC